MIDPPPNGLPHDPDRGMPHELIFLPIISYINILLKIVMYTAGSGGANDDGRPQLERFDLTGEDDVWGLGVGCNGSSTSCSTRSKRATGR